MRWWWIGAIGREWYSNATALEAREAAERDGAVIRSKLPVWGWAAKNARDGKWYPCGDAHKGAERAWIWYGDVPK